jgi:hypothetical protein
MKANTYGSQANHALTINLDQSDEAAQDSDESNPSFNDTLAI